MIVPLQPVSAAAVSDPDQLAALDRALRRAQEEGLELNFARWLAFRGGPADEWIELQALHVPEGRFDPNKAVHTRDLATTTRLLDEAERWKAPAIYMIANAIDPAIATRRTPKKWHNVRDKQGTSDRDIRARRVLYVDVDDDRPKGISATDAGVAATHATAVQIHRTLAALLPAGDASIAFGHSGNGRAIFLALDNIPETPTLAETVKGILAALRIRFEIPGIVMDTSVSEAKRLVPAWGTMKRKGEPGIPERPHRRTAILTPSTVARLSLAELQALLVALCADFTAEQCAAVEKAMGRRPAVRATTATTAGDSFRLANDTPIADVLAWLGLMNGEHPVCPGCGLSGDSSVAIVGNGVKCSHARCASKGVPGSPGFRTAIDATMEARGLTQREALEALAERFGLDIGRRPGQANTNGPSVRKAPAPPSGPRPVPARAEDHHQELDDVHHDDEADVDASPPALPAPLAELLTRLEALPREKRSGRAITPRDVDAAAMLEEAALADLMEALRGIGVRVGTLRKRIEGARARLARDACAAERAASAAAAGATRPATEADEDTADLKIDPNWEEKKLVRNRMRELVSAPANAITILRHDINWRGVLAFDSFRQAITFRRAPCWYDDDAPTVKTAAGDTFTDTDRGRLGAWLLRRYGLRLDKGDVDHAALIAAQANTYDSLRAELEATTWDGTPRLASWLTRYLGVAPSKYSEFVGPAFLISAIARAFDPGCQADATLILEGPQDRGKTSALRILFGDFYSETPLDLHSKDRFTNLAGVWCSSFDELASLRKSDADTVKNFLSATFDVYRPPFGTRPVRMLRRCVFAGTINPPPGAGYLKDPTGNRRFWPVLTAAHGPIDLEALRRDRAQIWAEALHRYRAGAKWWPSTDDERAICRQEQDARQEIGAWDELIAAWLAGGAGAIIDCKPCEYCRGTGKREVGARRTAGRFVTINDILEHALAIPRERWPFSYAAVAVVLARLEWVRGERRVKRRGVKVTPYYEPGATPDPSEDGEPVSPGCPGGVGPGGGSSSSPSNKAHSDHGDMGDTHHGGVAQGDREEERGGDHVSSSRRSLSGGGVPGGVVGPSLEMPSNQGDLTGPPGGPPPLERDTSPEGWPPDDDPDDVLARTGCLPPCPTPGCRDEACRYAHPPAQPTEGSPA